MTETARSALTERLLQIADDAAWSPPLRIAAQHAAAGAAADRIDPRSHADEDIRAALAENIRARRARPASVDVLPVVLPQRSGGTDG